jgi:hypothetical protein
MGQSTRRTAPISGCHRDPRDEGLKTKEKTMATTVKAAMVVTALVSLVLAAPVTLRVPMGHAADGAPSAPVTTMSPAGGNLFKLEWTVDPPRNATRRITGYVYNEYGSTAGTVQLLVQGLDPSGAVTARKIVWVVGGVPGFSRSYFEVGKLPPADHYQVTVWAVDFMNVPGFPG